MALLSTLVCGGAFPLHVRIFPRHTFGAPTIQYGLLIPIVVGLRLFWRWPLLKRPLKRFRKSGWSDCNCIEWRG